MQLGTCVLFRCKSVGTDMSKGSHSTDGNPFARVVHSADVTPVAQLAEAAPIAPPQNLEAEESVLGAMLLSPGAIGAVSEVLDASDFYRESHAKIYRAGLALYAKGEPVDAITLVDELEERSELEAVGGRVRMHELAALVPATANAAHYARIVHEMATLRGLIAAGQQIAQLGWERPGETQILVDRAEQVVFELSQSRVSTEFSHIEELLKESFERITALYGAGADVTGVPSGFRDLDRLTSGFQAGNLVIVAARPSMGKSALGLCIAANLALRHETPVALFTLEMSKSEVTQRLLCSEAKVESHRLRTGKLAQDDWPRLVAAGDKLMKAPIYVDDTGSITMMEIRSKARRLKTREPKLGLIIVDYLQLMTSGTTAENRVQEVSQISRNLKVLARDLDVPILAMSQLSPAVEQGHGEPTMTEAEVALLGHLIGDGCTLPRHVIQYTSKDRDLAELVAALATEVFGEEVRPRISAERTWFQVYLPSAGRLTHGVRNPVAKWLDELGVFGLRSWEKHVPEKVFAQPPELIATFLRHLWATDGCLRADPKRPVATIRYDSTSEALTRDVQSLLLRLGVNARTRRVDMGVKGRPIYRLDVWGREDAIRFLTVVRATGSRKQRQQWDLIEMFERRPRNPNVDVIPAEAWQSVVRPAMQKAGFTTRVMQRAIGTHYCGSHLYKSGL